jgi:chitinase
MRRFFLFCFLVLLATLPAIASVRIQQGQTPGTVQLYWDPNTETDLAGYKVYWGKISGKYDNSPVPTVGVMAQPTFTTPVLGNGTWYFAVTAYNTAGLESGYSNEVLTVISIAPAPPKGLRFTLAKLMACPFHHQGRQ